MSGMLAPDGAKKSSARPRSAPCSWLEDRHRGRLHGHRGCRSPRGAQVRVLRDNVVVYTGEVDCFKRMKDDVREVKEGFECG